MIARLTGTFEDFGPDWAVIDITTPADDRQPGKVTAAGFFGEKWEILPAE